MSEESRESAYLTTCTLSDPGVGPCPNAYEHCFWARPCVECGAVGGRFGPEPNPADELARVDFLSGLGQVADHQGYAPPEPEPEPAFVEYLHPCWGHCRGRVLHRDDCYGSEAFRLLVQDEHPNGAREWIESDWLIGGAL